MTALYVLHLFDSADTSHFENHRKAHAKIQNAHITVTYNAEKVPHWHKAITKPTRTHKAIVHRQPKRDKLPPCQIKSDSTSFN